MKRLKLFAPLLVLIFASGALAATQDGPDILPPTTHGVTEPPGPVPNVRMSESGPVEMAPVAPSPEPDYTPLPQDQIIVTPEITGVLSACDDSSDCSEYAEADCLKKGVGLESSTFSKISTKPCTWVCDAPCPGCPQEGGSIKEDACDLIPKPIPKPEA